MPFLLVVWPLSKISKYWFFKWNFSLSSYSMLIEEIFITFLFYKWKPNTVKRDNMGGQRWDNITCRWSLSCESLSELLLSRVYPVYLEYFSLPYCIFHTYIHYNYFTVKKSLMLKSSVSSRQCNLLYTTFPNA